MIKKTLFLISVFLMTLSCGTARKTAISGSSDNQEEEYVNTGYGKIKKKDSTSSVSSVKIKQGSGYSDIYEYLKGRVAGLVVNGTSISIRGVSSILGSNEPLILVDGMETSDISSLSPDMVERVDVLKDASSTAMYGSRGANGVIIITTRKTLDSK